MDVTQRIRKEGRSVAVETAYLLTRYLSHRLTKERFLRQLKADVQIPEQQKAKELVLEIVADIEGAEGSDIAHIANRQRAAYARQVESLLSDLSRSGIEQARVRDTLKQLRELRFSGA